MSNDLRAAAMARLESVVRRALADGNIDDKEREDLQTIYRQAILTVTDVRMVMGRYLRALETDVMADGVVTAEERARCKAVVTQLKIPAVLLPPQIKEIVES